MTYYYSELQLLYYTNNYNQERKGERDRERLQLCDILRKLLLLSSIRFLVAN